MESCYLKRLDTDDAETLFGLIQNNRTDLEKFSWVSSVQSVDDSRRFIESANQKELTNGAPTRAICIDAMPVGVAAVHPIDWQSHEASIGYWIDKNQYGKGIVTRAVGHLIDQTFAQLPVQTLSISTDIDNIASRTVAEKLGFNLDRIDTTATWRTDDTALQVAHYKRHLYS